MEWKSFMGAVVLGALLVVIAGISQAAGFGGAPGWRDVVEHWGPVETGSMPDSVVPGDLPESGSSNPEFVSYDTVEYWGAVEAGSLPAAGKKSRLLDTEVDPSRWEEPNAE